MYHSPSLASLPWCPVSWVQTIHDLIHLRHSGWVQKVYYALLLKPFARGALVVMTVSHASGNLLKRWLGFCGFKKRVLVTYNAIEASFAMPFTLSEESEANELLHRLGVQPFKFFLILSNSKPHKNLKILARGLATESQREDWPILSNVLLPGTDSKRVQLIGPATSNQIRILLARAGAVLFPSLEEGFGLPPLEALASGTPVLISDISPHREGIENLDLQTQKGLERSIHWLSPLDSSGWQHGMERAQRGDFERSSIEVRRAICERYSIERLGKGLDQVYRSVLVNEYHV